MNQGELFDIVMDHGSPVEAANATGRHEEIISALENLKQIDLNYLQNNRGQMDEFTIELYQDQIDLMRTQITNVRKEM